MGMKMTMYRRIARTLGTPAVCVMTLVGVAGCAKEADADRSSPNDRVADTWEQMTAAERGDYCFRWDLMGYEAFKEGTRPNLVSAWADQLRAECER